MKTPTLTRILPGQRTRKAKSAIRTGSNPIAKAIPEPLKLAWDTLQYKEGRWWVDDILLVVAIWFIGKTGYEHFNPPAPPHAQTVYVAIDTGARKGGPRKYPVEWVRPVRLGPRD